MSEKDQESLGDENEKKEEKQTCAQTTKKWLLKFVIKNFLPIVLIFAVIFGAFVPAPGVFFNHNATVYLCISILFFYVALYLETSAIKEAAKAYKANIWGCFSILLVTCVIGGQLTNLLTFDDLLVAPNAEATNSTAVNITSVNTSMAKEKHLGPFECKVGLIMYTIMPCSIGSGVIMIMSVKGHVAVGILTTVICNVVGVFTIPLYLEWLVYSNVNVKLDIGKMILKLFCTLFIPLVIGKILIINKRFREIIRVPSRKTKLQMVALSSLAFLLLVKTSQSSEDGGLKRITGVTISVICFWILALHSLFLLINALASFLLRLPIDQAKAVIILASQKNLSQSVAATVFLPKGLGDQGLIAVSIVFCHITILLFDSLLISIWLHVEHWYEQRKGKQAESQVLNDILQY